MKLKKMVKMIILSGAISLSSQVNAAEYKLDIEGTHALYSI